MTILNLCRHPNHVLKTKKLALATTTAAVCLMLGGYKTEAQTVNFDVPGGVGAVNYSGPGAASDTGIYWNPIAFQGTTSSGLLSDGVTASPVTLTDASLGNFNPGQGSQGTPGGLEAPYAYAGGNAVVTQTLHNVPAGTYNLYLYGKNYPYSDRGTAFSVSVGATSYGTQSTVCSSDGTFIQGNDYVEFVNVVVGAGGGTITFTYTSGASGGGEGDFNGLQLVTVQPHAINFDVPGGVGGVNYSGAGAASDSGAYWNPVTFQGTTSTGLASDGTTATPVTLTDASLGNYNGGQGTQGTPGGLEAPYAYAGGNAVVTETLQNVPAGSYDLFLYGRNYPYANRGTAFAVSVGATSYGTESTVGSAASVFTIGNDYVEFTNVVVAAGGGTITFTYTSGAAGGGEGDFNGLQLVNAASSNSSGPSPGPTVSAVWTGAVNNSWDVGATANWLTNGAAGVYSQGNAVRFDDTSSVNFIKLTSILSPTNVLVDNNSANYIFGGGGSLTGGNTFSLTKQGSATLTVSNANTFTGPVQIQGGILQVASGAALGNGSTVVSSGATLDLNGYDIGNDPVTVQGSGSAGQGAINNTGGDVYPAISDVTLSGNTTFGAIGRWDLRPQNGGTPYLSTGGHGYNLTKVGSGFIGLVGVTVDPKLFNIDVQQGTFDVESTTTLGDTNGTLTIEGGSTLTIWQLVSPLSKPIVFNDGSTLANNNGTTTFSGPITLGGYLTVGLSGSVIINGPFSGTGPLEIASGAGNSLSLNGANNYTGDVYMDSNVGTLALNGNGSGANGTIFVGNSDTLTVNGSFGGTVTDSGATGTFLFGGGAISGLVDFSGQVNPGGMNSPGHLTVGGLTLESGAVLNFDLSSSTTGSNDLIQVNGNLVLNNNSVNLNFLQGHLQVGTYRLINYTGTLSGSFGALATRAQATIDTSTPGQVNLIVTGGGTAANLQWNTGNGTWDVGVSANWLNLGTGNQDIFFSGDDVMFNDASGVPTTVTLAGTVSPGQVTVASSVNNYTFGGSGILAGSGGLAKSGSSTLVLDVAGTLTGPVSIASGTVQTEAATLGSVSSITVTNGGSLDFDGTTMAGNKPLTVSGAGASGGGALYNSGGAIYGSQVLDITMIGNTTFGGTSRWDLAPGSTLSGGYKVTVDETNNGYAEWDTVTMAANVGDMELTQGSWGLKGLGAGMGDPTKTLTVDAGTALTVWNSSVGPNSGYEKNIHVLTNASLAVRTSPSTHFDANVILEAGAQLDFYNGSGTGQTMTGSYLLNGLVTLQVGDSAIIFSNVLSGTGGWVWNIYNNEVFFAASNTYSGPTVIGSGLTLGLEGNGSITHSGLIFFGGNNAGSTSLDVSGRADRTLTLVNGQTLGGVGGINGSLTVLAGATLSPGGTNTLAGINFGANSTGVLAAASGVSLGGTTVIKLDGSGNSDEVQAGGAVTYGGTLQLVNISSAPLAAGNSFTIFNGAGYTGTFTSIVPTTPGTGLVWDVSQLNTSGVVKVVSVGGNGPVIANTRVTNGNLIFGGTGGPASGQYAVLTTTNLATAAANWTPLVTNSFDGSGNFSFTNLINPSAPQQFYQIKTQ